MPILKTLYTELRGAVPSVVFNPSSLHPTMYNIIRSEDYIHCDGTPLRLTDSDFGSEQYITSDYYVWLSDERSQLLFIFPTGVILTTITLHYYRTYVRGLPRLRFWSAAVPPSGNTPAGLRNISINIEVFTKKVLLFKFSSSSSFALSEVEFFAKVCTSKS